MVTVMMALFRKNVRFHFNKCVLQVISQEIKYVFFDGSFTQVNAAFIVHSGKN